MNAPTAPPARRGLRLGRLFGIEICLDFSVVLIFALIVYSIATGIALGALNLFRGGGVPGSIRLPRTSEYRSSSTGTCYAALSNCGR